MNTNTSLVTDTSVAVAETSVDAYRDQISRHIDNDLSAHTSIQLHLVGFYEQAPASTHLVADASLRVLLTNASAVNLAYALPALIQPGVFVPAGSAPVILRQPVNVTTAVNGNAVFSVYVASSSPGFYQWQKNNVDITGANDATLTLVSVQVSDVGTYRCVITNVVGQAISAGATLSVTTV